MHDKKVSEKAIWEGSITPDSDTPSLTSQIPQQPQMMFCYKCNNVIPGNSKFCPCCQTELYVICPKCGVKYSSQYPICNQCGTNREEYLETQRREILRQEKLEQERKEQERKEALERQEREAHWKRQKEQIINTKEYQLTYSILEESLYSIDRKFIMTFVLSLAFPIVFMIASYWLEEPVIILFGGSLAILGLIWSTSLHACLTDIKKREQYILQYLKKNNCNYNKDILNYVLNEMRGLSNKVTLDNLSEWCIEAYIKQNEVSSL